MLIKEYRIPLPLTVEEYKIAQLYMIQKKSREESEGEGSAVEILKNHPYTDGPNGSGQYTYKVYHIGRHLPGWFRNIAPKTALEVHEESWNSYPYTKTKFSVPFVDKFSIEVETYFESDGGTQENKFKLNRSELRQRELDVIDIVNDQLTGHDYNKEEDPRLYVSKKNGRGPLADDWIANPPDGVIMCSYKLIKVEFRYWGLQSKIERFIHDYGLRRVMLRAHRQAWAWQDEWAGLTIDDIRKLEKETQLILQRKLGRMPVEEAEGEAEGQKDELQASPSSASGNMEVRSPLHTSHSASDTPTPTQSATNLITHSHHSGATLTKRESLVRGHGCLQKQGSMDSWTWERRRNSRVKRMSIHSNSSRKFSNASTVNEPAEGAGRSGSVSMLVGKGSGVSLELDEDMRTERVLDQIELSDSDSEYFDAQDTVCVEEDSEEEERSMEEEGSVEEGRVEKRRAEERGAEEEEGQEEEEEGRAEGGLVMTPAVEELASRSILSQSFSTNAGSVDYSGDELDPTSKSTPIDFLFLVLHGGSIMDPISDRVGKTLDFSTLQTNIQTITELHYRSAIGRIAMRMVPCKNICNKAFKMLCEVSPIPVANMECTDEGLLPKSSLEVKHTKQPYPSNFGNEEFRDCPCFLPVGSIPIIATECCTYNDTLKRVTEVANRAYQEFLHSEEGFNFSGQVCLIGDCMGSVLGYDILTSMASRTDRTPSPPPLTPSPTQKPSRSLGMPRRKISSAAAMPFPPEKHRDRVNTNPMSGSTPPQLRPQQLALLERGKKKGSLSSLNSECSSNASINVCQSDSSHFCFPVSHFFAFGSPLGLILASRRAKSNKTAFSPPPRPSCHSFYNIFYGVDTTAARLEPILDQRFSTISPVTIPMYRSFPTGSTEVFSLKDTVVKHPYLFANPRLQLPIEGERNLRKKAISHECLISMDDDAPVAEDRTADLSPTSASGIKPFSVWWSNNRIDYILETPWGNWGGALEQLPTSTFSHVIHSRYWEAKELASFVLRQVLLNDMVFVKQRRNGREMLQAPFVPRQSVTKWKRKTTNVRISHLRSNHRAVDVVALEDVPPPCIPAKFMYGPLDMASLIKEEVEVYMFNQSPKPAWEYVGCENTDKHGKIMFDLSKSKSFSPGHYPIKFLVKGDHTTASCNLYVVPPHVEAVVFSVDGALASNFSLSAKDMKLKHGAVEVARSWQELGYFIIYISRRPDWQKDCILNFLGCHGFPLGLVACAESFSPDSHSVKTAFLARLIKEAKIIIHAGYGSSRHLGLYKELNLQPDQIYIHGRRSKSRRPTEEDCQYLTDGFASHHNDLLKDPPRKAMHDARQWFGEASFSLPGHQSLEQPSKKHKPKRAAYKRSKSPSLEVQGPNSHKGSVPSHLTKTILASHETDL